MTASSVQYRVLRSTRASKIAAVLGLTLLIALIAAPWWAGRADMRLLGELFLYLSLASLWNLMAGYAGLVSVGQQAYVAIPVASLIFKLRGAYFAIGTWAIAEVFRLSFAQVSALGGGSGTSLPVNIVKSLASSRQGRESLSYWLALGSAVLILISVYLLLRSNRGLALTAIRDNELAASSLGINIPRTQLLVYVVTCALTAMVGAIIFLQKLRISPDAAFSVNDWTAFVIFIVVIGGIGTIEGPIIGTLIFFALRETLADFGTIYLLALGAIAIVIMLKAPNGVWGFIRQRFKIQLFPFGYQLVKRD